MLFALSPRAEDSLTHAFKTHAIQRAYLAVAQGNIPAPTTIESWLVRDRGDGLRGSDPRGKDAPDAQRAVTHIDPVEHLADRYTVVRCRLETGRTHQIRIHLAESGHPLCGEKVYVRPAPGARAIEDDSGAPRHALHSAELEFIHPIAGERMKFTSPWPRDLSDWLKSKRRDLHP
jgi:23S rRNA pseudouridine1911/1915/1917 synthase